MAKDEHVTILKQVVRAWIRWRLRNLRYRWVLPVYQYKKPEQLLATLAEKVIAPMEGKVKDLRRRMTEAETDEASIAFG